MAFNPPIPADFYFPFAIIFSVIGIFAFLWMIFFLETSRDLSRRERIIGLTIRLIVSSFTLGFALTLWGLIGFY